MKDFKVTKGETKYINTTKSTDFIHELEKELRLPLTNYFLSETQIKSKHSQFHVTKVRFSSLYENESDFQLNHSIYFIL